jgi:hypothetical protein
VTPSQQYVAQLAAAAVLGWALGNLALELVKGAAATAWRWLAGWRDGRAGGGS